MSAEDLADLQRQLHGLLEAIRRGEMSASPSLRSRLEGALVALGIVLDGSVSKEDNTLIANDPLL